MAMEMQRLQIVRNASELLASDQASLRLPALDVIEAAGLGGDVDAANVEPPIPQAPAHRAVPATEIENASSRTRAVEKHLELRNVALRGNPLRHVRRPVAGAVADHGCKTSRHSCFGSF